MLQSDPSLTGAAALLQGLLTVGNESHGQTQLEHRVLPITHTSMTVMEAGGKCEAADTTGGQQIAHEWTAVPATAVAEVTGAPARP